MPNKYTTFSNLKTTYQTQPESDSSTTNNKELGIKNTLFTTAEWFFKILLIFVGSETTGVSKPSTKLLEIVSDQEYLESTRSPPRNHDENLVTTDDEVFIEESTITTDTTENLTDQEFSTQTSNQIIYN